ncbi:MAG: CpaF family protein [Bacteriovoracaceae bacterium]|nr:CpaF family protein [Bacteriovoracaceae bacterium]
MNTDELASKNSVWHLLKELSSKAGITDIIINGSNNVYVERANEFIRLSTELKREDIYQFCQEIAQFNKTTLTETNPIIDGRLPDGSRINIISDMYTTGTHAITIRKYLKHIKTFDSSPGIFGIKDLRWIEFFRALVNARSNILISGGTGAGKTTFMNLMLQEIPKTQRVITIEDTRELQFNLTNVVRLEAKNTVFNTTNALTTRQLLKNTLRMRPDRIIVGEVRGEEAFDLLQAMNTGHDGSMSTLHSNSPSEALIRLENLFLLAGYDIPTRPLRYQIAKAIDYVIQIGRNKEGERVLMSVTEVVGMEEDRILQQEIGAYKEDTFEFTGLVPAKMRDLIKVGLDPAFFNK